MNLLSQLLLFALMVGGDKIVYKGFEKVEDIIISYQCNIDCCSADFCTVAGSTVGGIAGLGATLHLLNMDKYVCYIYVI